LREDVPVQRRWFLLGMGSGVLAACHPWARPSTKPEKPGPHDLETLAAMADTFLPGGDGMPGARDVGAVGVIVDPAYGVNPYISELVSDLDDWCMLRHSGKFFELEPAERELALEERMGLRDRFVQSAYLPVYEGVLALTKVAYYGAVTSRLGTNAIGYPGPSTGYAAASAAGAYPAADTPRPVEPGTVSEIEITGEGRIASLRVSALVTSNDDVHATLRLVSPDGKTHDFPARAGDGHAILEDLPAAGVAGSVAAGRWQLVVASVAGGSGQLELWSVRVRTDLDG
jgi:hypothetical protein